MCIEDLAPAASQQQQQQQEEEKEEGAAKPEQAPAAAEEAARKPARRAGRRPALKEAATTTQVQLCLSMPTQSRLLRLVTAQQGSQGNPEPGLRVIYGLQEAPKKDKPKRGKADKSAASVQTAPAGLHTKPELPARRSRAAKSVGEPMVE